MQEKHLKTHPIDYFGDIKYCVQDIFKKRTKEDPGNKKKTQKLVLNRWIGK